METRIYKTASGHDLRIEMFLPEADAQKNARSAICFYHGGGWTGGTPGQFHEQCKHLASRGMVACTAEYRLVGSTGDSPLQCLADGKSAMRWLRARANELGFEPNRLVAGGGSAGASVAAWTYFTEGFEDEADDLAITCVPNALVLFNPALEVGPQRAAKHADFANHAKELTPINYVSAGAPPTVLFYGSDDTTTPVATAETFTKAMHDAGAVCELNVFDGKGHGFFNHGRDDNVAYERTLAQMDAFLVAQSLLPST